MWLLLGGICLVPPEWRGRLAPLWIALLWAYCVLDHVDGCRARLRRTSSAWGEFLDHGLDAWHGSILVVAIAVVSGTAVRPAVVVVTVAASGLATVATWLEQRWRGEFFLGRCGPVEAVLLAGLYLATWWLPGASAWWSAPAITGLALTRAEAVFLLGAVGAFAAAASAVRRAPGSGWTLAGFLLAVLTMLAAGQAGVSWPATLMALTLLTVEMSARVLVSHLARQASPRPDWVGASLLVLGAWSPAGRAAWVAAGLLWLAVRTAGAWRVAVALRKPAARRG